MGGDPGEGGPGYQTGTVPPPRYQQNLNKKNIPAHLRGAEVSPRGGPRRNH